MEDILREFMEGVGEKERVCVGEESRGGGAKVIYNGFSPWSQITKLLSNMG